MLFVAHPLSYRRNDSIVWYLYRNARLCADTSCDKSEMNCGHHFAIRVCIVGRTQCRTMFIALNSLSRVSDFPFRRLLLILLGMIASVMVEGSPVQAATRDQVMSRAFGCAEIGDARLWLDCYYGAAQPVRATLGMQAAPAAQIALAQSPPAGSAPQAADIRESVLSGATRCGELNDDRDWLNCYYVAAQPMRVHLNLPPAPQLAQALQREAGYVGQQNASISRRTPSNAGDNFGLSNGPSRMASVSARMISFEFNRKGIFTVALSNGEVWRQLSGDTSFARWKGDPGKYAVHISHGLLGSYNLEVLQNPGLFKVRRVR